ncbi:MAG: hypothetical protein PHX18_02105 [Candidatus Gastranaerophilales bacterium]|nr:hypothetical protein [Candidatus Gastranaerophilales bacterium]
MSAGSFIAKTIGIAALGIAGYDSLSSTHRNAVRDTQAQTINQIEDVYLRNDSMETQSIASHKIRNWAQNWFTDTGIMSVLMGVKNYVTGFFGNITDNAITFGLGFLALFASKSKPGILGKAPIVGKLAAGLLALQAGKFIVCDMFGLFKTKPHP